MTSERPDPLALIAKMAQKEQQLSESLFLAPVVAGGSIRVRVDGVVYEMKVEDRSFEGWALLKCIAPGRATVSGTPSNAQVSAYLKLLPRVRLILLDRYKNQWWGLQASVGDKNFKINGPVPIYGLGAAASFDTVYSRFDGSNFWFEAQDRRRDPHIARSLRKALNDDAKPAEVQCKGMIPEELMAYVLLWMEKHPELAPPKVSNRRGKGRHAIEPEAPKTQLEMIRDALAHAGAELDTYWEQANRENITVRFIHRGQTHTANIHGNDLTLQSAGVCLRGQDQKFDLTSLVGVLDQYQRDHPHGLYDDED